MVSVVSGLFSLAAIWLFQINWFKRERFKFEIDTKKKEYNLNFKKMARDLGLTDKEKTYRAAAGTTGDTIGGLLNIAKNLNPDQLSAIADIVGGSEESEGSGGIDGLLQFAQSNPDLVKGFLDGLKNKAAGGSSGPDQFL